jgi:hypothetical protein
MPPHNASIVAWWSDRYDAKPFSINSTGVVGDLSDLSDEERDIVKVLAHTKYDGDFIASTSMTSSEVRGSVRLMRRGVLFATFHITPTIGEAFFKRVSEKNDHTVSGAK